MILVLILVILVLILVILVLILVILDQRRRRTYTTKRKLYKFVTTLDVHIAVVLNCCDEAKHKYVT